MEAVHTEISPGLLIRIDSAATYSIDLLKYEGRAFMAKFVSGRFQCLATLTANCVQSDTDRIERHSIET